MLAALAAFFTGSLGLIAGALARAFATAVVGGVVTWLNNRQTRADQIELGAQTVAKKSADAAADLEKAYAEIGANPPDSLSSLRAGTF